MALSHIGALFRLERTIADASRKKKEEVRHSKSRPIVDKFFDWCDAEAPHVLDESPISAAIGYSRNQRVALRRFLDDGRLPLHNNISELNLRRQVLGRRNWLFVGSDDGARVNTIFVSLLASARMHDIEPLAYLRDLLLLAAELASESPPGARPRLLEEDFRGARNSAEAALQRFPSCRAFAAVNCASHEISTTPRGSRQ